MVLLFQLLHSKISLFYGTFFTCDIMKKFFLFYLALPFVFCDIFGCFFNFKVHTYLYPIKVHVHREQNQNIISSQLHSEFVFNSCLTHCDFTFHCISLPIHQFVTLHHTCHIWSYSSQNQLYQYLILFSSLSPTVEERVNLSSQFQVICSLILLQAYHCVQGFCAV